VSEAVTDSLCERMSDWRDDLILFFFWPGKMEVVLKKSK
jgi:hypothetical protein